jgi:hypothetical protein
MCACCNNESHLKPVNSVLKNSVKRTVLVQNRDTANRVIEFFREHRIGIVSCEIIDEVMERNVPPRKGDWLWLPDLLSYKSSVFKRVFMKLIG